MLALLSKVKTIEDTGHRFNDHDDHYGSNSNRNTNSKKNNSYELPYLYRITSVL